MINSNLRIFLMLYFISNVSVCYGEIKNSDIHNVIFSEFNLNVDVMEEEEYEYLYPIIKTEVAAYFEAYAIVMDGKFLSPDQDVVRDWFLSKEFDIISLAPQSDCSEKTRYVNNNWSSLSEINQDQIGVNKYIDENMEVYIESGESNIFINNHRVINKLKGSIDIKGISLHAYKELDLKSKKFKTRIKIFSTEHGVVGLYLKYSLNKAGNVIGSQGAFSISESLKVDLIKIGEAVPYAFDGFNLGDFDHDGKGNFMLRYQLKNGIEYTSFYEYKDNFWLLEKKLENKYCK